MTVSLVAMDYSRPVQPMFKLPSRAGTIHSVFRRAINIALDDTILALLSNELLRMPNSVRLPPVVASAPMRLANNLPEGTRKGHPYHDTKARQKEKELLWSREYGRDRACPYPGRLWSLRPGTDVQVGDGRLLIPACDFSLSLPEALPWEPRPEITMCHWCRETVVQHVRLLARYLTDQPQQGGLIPLIEPLLLGQPAQETPLAQMALPVLRMLAWASWRQDMAGVEEATRRLAGLGPGLTPAGDDALGGFAAVMALLSSQLSADAAPRDQVAAMIAAAARPHTTALSAVLLAHAARGEVAEHLGQLLLALALPIEESETVLRAADRVLAFGATSGGDTLLGMLLGVRALEGEID